MSRGGARPGAGRKPNPHKGKSGEAGGGARNHIGGYDPSVAIQARKLCELGATDIEVADFFELDVATIYRWKIEYPDFCDSMKAGKDAADDRVEKSLYNRAVGYSYPAVKIMAVGGKVKQVPYREHVPPDPGAATKWLSARRKEQWRDKPDSGIPAGELRIIIENDPDAGTP